ncbi:hypothetical protein ACQKGO_35685 [Corallococcus interemptor]|uniref:hypothetical protein n=1 Tax=Corallococcus interemptor TaxID=2316720 RepID=UPI003D074029
MKNALRMNGSGVVLAAVLALGCGGVPEEQPAPASHQEAALTVTGDFDGDGSSDTLTTSLTGISIHHPAKGTTKFYGFSGSFAVNNATQDLDGTVGLEVVVVTSGGISVITDKKGTSQFYSFSGSFSIVNVSDTDGVAGAEVVTAALGGVSVIRHRSASSYFYPFSGTYQVNTVVDTNGVAGAELFISTSTNKYILTDRTGQTTTTTQTGC